MMSDSDETYQEVWDRMEMMKLNYDDQSMARNRAQVCPNVSYDNVGALDDEMKNLKLNDGMIDNLDDGMKSMRLDDEVPSNQSISSMEDNMELGGEHCHGVSTYENEVIKGELRVKSNYLEKYKVTNTNFEEKVKGYASRVDQMGKKVTKTFMKNTRIQEWKRIMEWDDNDMERILDCEDALPELIQDYEHPVVLVGSDVVSLYPNLEIGRVVENIKEAVLTSDTRWDEVDYQEAVRYLALN